MKQLKIILFAVVAVLLQLTAVGQTVSNVTFQQEGQIVKVYYNLSAKADISVEVSTDGGRSYGTPRMTHVSGDVGKEVAAGNGKCIVWNVLQDCERLQGDRICFKVRASSGGSNHTFTVGGVSFMMVYVEGGTFTMGCTSEQGGECDSDEKPSHGVTLSSYYIGETEVTQALWKAVMGTEPTYNGGWTDKYGRGTNYPAYRVSYTDVETFITRLNQKTGRTFRMPTEAEWEFAARGGKKSHGHTYSGSSSIGDVAWYDGNSGNKTHPVKQKLPNELGIYDMSGNVWEWCSDWLGSYSSGSQTNPKGPSSGAFRVFRGGSWGSGARYFRVSLRYGFNPSYRSSIIGFRLVLVP